jgi:hypothetical protein
MFSTAMVFPEECIFNPQLVEVANAEPANIEDC